MEPIKRKYQKHKTDKKIGLRFYLNQKLKAKNRSGIAHYPIYVQLTVNSQTKHFRSLTGLYSPENELSTTLENNKELFSEEERIILKTAQETITRDNNFAQEYSSNVDQANRLLSAITVSELNDFLELDDAVEYFLKIHLKVSLLFMTAHSSEMVNDFYEELINWDSNTASFLYEHLPMALKIQTPLFKETIDSFSYLAINYPKGVFNTGFPLGVRPCDWKDGAFINKWNEVYNKPDKAELSLLIPSMVKLLKDGYESLHSKN